MNPTLKNGCCAANLLHTLLLAYTPKIKCSNRNHLALVRRVALLTFYRIWHHSGSTGRRFCHSYFFMYLVSGFSTNRYNGTASSSTATTNPVITP